MYTYKQGKGWVPADDFVRTPCSGVSGSCLQAYLDDVELNVIALFGKPDPDGYVDDEKGYDGNEYHFTEQSTGQIVNLYARYGEWRVGALTKAVADRFVSWLKDRVSQG